MAIEAPSNRELDVLKVLWHRGESKVRDVHKVMNSETPCAFTTVQTLLRIMAKKNLVTCRQDGRTLYYSANHSIEKVSSRFLNKVFDGALEKMVLSMLRAEEYSADELKRLEKLIAQSRKSKQKSKES